jgi:ribosomal protein L7/L12
MTFVIICVGVVVVLILAGLLGMGKTPEPPANVSDEDILRIARQGQKIQAIKWYRSLHQVGLKDAKEAVEKMTARS